MTDGTQVHSTHDLTTTAFHGTFSVTLAQLALALILSVRQYITAGLPHTYDEFAVPCSGVRRYRRRPSARAERSRRWVAVRVATKG